MAESVQAYSKPFIPLHSDASIWPQSQYKRPIEIDTQAKSVPATTSGSGASGSPRPNSMTCAINGQLDDGDLVGLNKFINDIFNKAYTQVSK